MNPKLDHFGFKVQKIATLAIFRMKSRAFGIVCRGMEPLIYKKHCMQCDKDYEATYPNCPHCHAENEKLRGNHFFDNDIHVGPLQNVGLLLMGLVGFQLFGAIISFIVQANFIADYRSGHPGAEIAEIAEAWLEAYLSNPSYAMLINGLSYALVFIGLLLILWQGIKEFGASFKKFKNIGIGFLCGIGLIALSFTLGLILGAFRPETTANNNQASLERITTGGYAIFALIVFGFIGPVCEELTYRVGLFSFTKRFNRVAAYIICSIIFGLIHFDWECFSKGGELIANELFNLPDYILAGTIFCLGYEKFGIAGRVTAHITNNVISLGFTILAANMK